MTDNERNERAERGTDRGTDTESALQEELRREAAEGKEAIGDVSSNQNVSGSSTWETQRASPETERGEVF
jgi:hypothetical protein